MCLSITSWVYHVIIHVNIWVTNRFIQILWLQIGWWPPTIWTDFPRLSSLLYDYYIAFFCRWDSCYTFFLLLSQYDYLMIMTCHYSYWPCILFTNYALVLVVYVVYWCIGTNPYLAEEIEEDQTFQAFEPVDEPKWSFRDGYEAVLVYTRETFIIETIFSSNIFIMNLNLFSCLV